MRRALARQAVTGVGVFGPLTDDPQREGTMKYGMMSLATVLALAVSVAASAETRTYFGFQSGLGHAPPPPRVVFYSEPRMQWVPETHVMILAEDPGYDMFRYGSWYYVCDDGFWYRSRNYRGPFAVIDVRRVPEPVFYVPAERWHHHPRSEEHTSELQSLTNIVCRLLLEKKNKHT